MRYTVIALATEKECQDYCDYLNIRFECESQGKYYAKVITD